MLTGEKMALRARVEEDVAVLHRELYDDVAEYVRAHSRPWVPLLPGSRSPFAILSEPTDAALPSAAQFSIIRLAGGELVGDAVLWGIHPHQRSAYIGLSLLPAARGQGLGTDTLRVLCHYAFAVRGLHRVSLETLSDNAPMMASAQRVGFVREGQLRESSWVNGRFVDDALFGLLDREWTQTYVERG